MISGKKTEDLLKNISSRLSGREDCKKLNYRVVISDNYVEMDPLVWVYPDRYHRKETDKLGVVEFVRHNVMNDVSATEFVPGCYEYQLSADGKNRRWRKLD